MSGWKINQVSVKVGGFAPAARAAPQARDPAADARLVETLRAIAESGDYPRAAGMAETAVAAGLEHPFALNLAALKYEHEGRFGDALRVLDRAIRIAPDDIGARNAAGLVLTRLERYREALAMFDSVLALEPDIAGAHCARGLTLQALGRTGDAEAAYDRALALDPENLGALQGLANVLSRRGEHAKARPLAEAVLAAEPNFPDAVMVLAAADAAEGAGERAQRRLDLLVGDERLSAPQRALAQGLLGDVLDAQDRPGDAFQAYAACNATLQKAYQPAYGRGPGALDLARATIAELDRLPPESWTSAGGAKAADAPRTHVFLLGFPRSGAALLHQALAGHPDVAALEERETLQDGLRAFLAQPGDLARLAKAPEADLQPLREAYWARVRGEGAEPAGKVFVDTAPLNTLRLPLILKLFPEATILFAQRDPRDVVLSAFRRRFAMSGAAYQLLTLPGAAAYYDAAMKLADRLQAPMAGRARVVRHEAVVEDFDRAMGEVCEALGLAWTDALREAAGRGADRAVATPSGAPFSVGLAAEGVGAWRRYAAQLAPVQPQLKPWVEAFGYPPE